MKRALRRAAARDARSSTASASSETGGQGQQRRRSRAADRAAPRFRVGDETTVLDDDLRPAPGRRRRQARRGAATSRSATTRTRRRPRRRSPSSTACAGRCPATTPRIEDDGTITCSAAARCRSTPAARRCTPKRSRRRSKSHAAVFDAVVVGVPDERWGERVVAVVQPRPGATLTARRARRARPGAARRLQGAARARARRHDRALAVGQARLPLGRAQAEVAGGSAPVTPSAPR